MEITTVRKTTSKGRTIAVWILRIIIGLIFIAIALAKLAGVAQTVQLFEAIGWGQWFRFLTGLVDLVGAILIFVPRWTCYGAILVTCTIGLATMLYIVVLHNNPAVPLALTLLSITLAWVTRPRRVNRSGSIGNIA